jgi:hydroxybutyrate-dimer hydrolase
MKTRQPLLPLAAAPDHRAVLVTAALALLLAACGTPPARPETASEPVIEAIPPSETRVTVHRDGDDLLSAGLGLAGLRNPQLPAFANAEEPTADELRRRAIWNNWRGIADLSPGGGYGSVYGDAPSVPGREFHSQLRLPESGAAHRVMLQLPDAFDARARCLLLTASSGSRGIYGAISLAGAWGLPRGCAVAYTDKGAGTDLLDAASGEGVALDGRLTSDPARMLFRPTGSTTSPWVAYRHAHSQDNPEADWGRHLRQTAEFALRQLDQALPAQAPFTLDNTRIIAVGLSNAGGVVLRAAELEQDWLDGVVAIAPNVLPGDGGRALYDYASDAALWMTCAQSAPALADAPLPLPPAVITAQREAACAGLRATGLVDGADPAQAAYEHLRQSGWTDAALRAGMLSTAFDLWRSVGVTYASAYGRHAFDAMPCGFAFAAVDAGGQPRSASRSERAAWWSDSSGVGPGNGIQIVEREAGRPAHQSLQCLRTLWTGDTPEARGLRAGVEATRAGLPRVGLPVLLIHGMDDGLVPEAFSGGAYAAWVKRAGDRDLSYWAVHRAQHFDAFLALPTYGSHYVPLLPYAYAGLDAMWARLDGGESPGDRQFHPQRDGYDGAGVAPLTAENLRLPGR